MFVHARCENCNFRANFIEIENNKFISNAGFRTTSHLLKHNDHIIILIFPNMIGKYYLKDNNFVCMYILENNVKGE